MLDGKNPEFEPIISSIGFNDGANKGFWRIQPRDDEGQWIEMGADVLFRFRTGSGNLVVATERGVYVGPGGRPGMARVLISKDTESGLKAGVYQVESRNLQQFKAIIPNAKSKAGAPAARKDKFGKPVRTLEDSKLPALQDLLSGSQKITEEDRRLAQGDLTPEEREAEQDGRQKSPIADLPAGFESENPEEVKKLLRESGVDPDEFDKNLSPTFEEDPELKKRAEEATKGRLQRKEKPTAYGRGNAKDFSELPDGTILDEYERAQFYPSLEDYDGPFGPVSRKIIKKDGKWFELGENGKPKGAAIKRAALIDSLNSRVLADSGASSKTDETGKKVAAWADEVEQPAASDPVDDVVKDLMADVAFDGDTAPDLDSVLKKQEALISFRQAAKTQKVPFDLDRGDIVLGEDGSEKTVLDVELGNAATGVPAKVRVQNSDGSIEELSVSMRDKLNIATGRRGQIRRPQAPASRPAAPAPEATTPETPRVDPETVEPGEMTPEDGLTIVMTPEGLAPANFPPADRLDDGSNFDLPTLTDEELAAARGTKLAPLLDPDGTPAKYVDENGNLVDAEDPFAMLAALAKVFPNAKFAPDGSLILHRQVDTKSGKIFELRASNSGKRAIVYSFRFYDPGNPENYVEYQHKDDRHSVTALFSASNGPEGLLDRLLGRVDRKGKNWGLPENFKFGNTKYQKSDSLFKRSRWFRSGTGDRKKMEEIGDNAVRLAEGRSAVLEKDTKRIKNSAIPSLWEAFDELFKSGPTSEERDVELKDMFYQTLYGVFGRIPLGEKSHSNAKKAIRAEFRRRFPAASKKMERSFDSYVSAASERMRGIYRATDPKVRSIRYASKDRTRTIERGMTVEYTNNVGQTSIVKVTDLVENTTSSPNDRDSYDYGDNVIVTDANGRKIRINAIKLKIMLSQGTPLTAYRPNLLGEELRQARIDSGLAEAPSTSRPRRIPGAGTVISAPAPPPMLIDDFVVGEMLYSKSDGSPLGIIKAVRPTTSRNGTQGLAFLYTSPDGTENQVAYALGTEVTPKKV
jgi:hypothetical protein